MITHRGLDTAIPIVIALAVAGAVWIVAIATMSQDSCSQYESCLVALIMDLGTAS